MSAERSNAGAGPPDPHAGEPLRTRGPAPAEADAALVLLHGRGGSPEDMLALTREWRASGVSLLAPRAAGRSWYPRSFMAPTEENEPHLSSALRRVERIVSDLEEAGVAAERQMVLGFSQGACLALEFSLRNPRRYGAVVGLSGGLIGPEGTSWKAEGSLDGTPAFLGCSDRDPHIPRTRVEESGGVLDAAGAAVDVRIYEGLGHAVNRDEVGRVQEMIDGLRDRGGG